MDCLNKLYIVYIQSKLDKKLVRRFYGPPRKNNMAKGDVLPVDSNTTYEK